MKQRSLQIKALILIGLAVLAVIGYLTICVMAVVMFLYNNRKTC